MRNGWVLRLRHAAALLMCIVMLVSLGGCAAEIPSADKASMTVTDADDTIAQLEAISEELGYDNALSELTEKSSTTIDGDHYYRMQQNYKGIPVYGKMLVCATDESGNVTSITGNPEDIVGDVTVSPRVTSEQVTQSVCAYWEIQWGYVLDDWCLNELSSENLYIFISQEDNSAHLAYVLDIGFFEFIVDAESTRIISVKETVMEESAIGYRDSDSAQEKGFPIYKLDDYYILRDVELGFDVYSYGQRDSHGEDPDKNFALPVESADIIFGNTDNERALGYEQGAYLLYNARLVHSYLTDISCSPKYDKINLFYYDGYYGGNNATGGYDDNGRGTISFGYNYDISQAFDTLGHEYCHVIQFSLIDNLQLTGEIRSILEGMSDIYGEIIEARVTHNEPDWQHTSLIEKNTRNILEPRQNKNALTLSDWDEEGIVNHNEDYYYSTLISHTGYLMWNGIDGNEAKRISLDDLAKLWYRAMLMMPSDCDFTGCRQLVELAATSMELTTAQIACVSEAFDAVGITGTTEESFDALYDLALDGTLSVYGGDGKLCGNYTLDITGNTTIYGPVIEKVDSSYSRTRVITDAEPYELNLPQGIYTFTITDNANPSATNSFTVCVQDNEGDDNIDIFTNFGYTPVKGTVSEITEVNGIETNVPISNAVVTVYSHAQESVVETIDMSETDGFFEVFLPIGNYSFGVKAEGYISSTTSFELTSDNAEYLVIILEPTTQKQLTSVVVYQAGDKSEEYRFAYNNLGQIVNLAAYRYEVGNAIEWYTQNYEYDGNGNPILVEHISSRGNVQTYKYQYDYDTDGRITGYGFMEYYEDTPAFSESYIFSYDDQGRVIGRRDEFGSSVEEFSYDESGKTVCEYYERYWGDGHFIETTVYDYTYAPLVISTRTSESKEYGNSSGKSISFSPHWNLTVASGTIDDTCSFEIDSSGYLLRVIDTSGNNVFVCNYQEPLTGNSEYADWYKQVLQTHPEATKYSYTSGGEVREYQYDTAYTLYDIDKDGMPELIVQEDLSNYYVYTMGDSGVILCGKFYWWYSDCLYVYDGNGLIVHDGGTGSMRLEYLWLYTLSNGILNSTDVIISTEESTEDAFYDCLNEYECISSFVPITDYSLLENE